MCECDVVQLNNCTTVLISLAQTVNNKLLTKATRQCNNWISVCRDRPIGSLYYNGDCDRGVVHRQKRASAAWLLVLASDVLVVLESLQVAVG